MVPVSLRVPVLVPLTVSMLVPVSVLVLPLRVMGWVSVADTLTTAR